MNTSFHAVMKKSDKDLISIVYVNSKDYEKSAVAAAEEELKTRNVSFDRKENIIENAKEEADYNEQKLK